MSDDKSRENRLRRWAVRLGYQLKKSRVRAFHYNDMGGYMLVEIYRNVVVDGDRFNLTLDYVEDWLKDKEFELKAERDMEQ